MDFNPNISQFYLLVMAGLGLFLLLISRQVKELSYTRLNKLNRFQEILRLLPALEGLMWLVFALTAISLIFRDKFFYSIGILMILIVTVGWISWFFVRDFMAGIMLRSNRSIELGDRLKFKGFEGILKRIGHFSITLESDQGTSTIIPFSIISGAMLTKIKTKTSLQSQVFRVQIDGQMQHRQLSEQIRRLVLTAPWTSITHEPKVTFIAENKQYITYEITTVGVQECYLSNIKNYLESHLNQKNQGITS